jgi:hypothetical protein
LSRLNAKIGGFMNTFFSFSPTYEIVALEKICGDNSYRETIEKLWMKDRLIMN